MPIRDYECASCHHRFDALVRTPDEEQDLRCPSCGHNELQRCFTFPSTYSIAGDNSASVRPKRMGGTN